MALILKIFQKTRIKSNRYKWSYRFLSFINMKISNIKLAAKSLGDSINLVNTAGQIDEI